MLLKGKTAIVTGSSKGIGQGVAIGLAKEGAAVVVNGTSAEDVAKTVAEIKKAEGKAVACVESVATVAGAERIVKCALDNFGKLDILVNNAGILRDRTFMKMSEQEWDDVVAVHLKGTWACTKAATVPMSQQGSGRIINMSSLAAWDPGIGQCNYAAAKAGILGLTLGIFHELARYGITVNAVAPRALTRMTIPLIDKTMAREKEAALRANAPVPTPLDIGYGTPDMMAPLVCYLASDDAKDITGAIFRARGEMITVMTRNRELATMVMNGGWTADEVAKRFKVILGPALRSEEAFSRY